MKKLQITFIVAILLMGFCSVCLAQNAANTKTGRNNKGLNFIDNNNDGICDNNTLADKGYKGRNFIDKNNDGICDNHGKGIRGNGKCRLNGNRNGKGNLLGKGNGNHRRYNCPNR